MLDLRTLLLWMTDIWAISVYTVPLNLMLSPHLHLSFIHFFRNSAILCHQKPPSGHFFWNTDIAYLLRQYYNVCVCVCARACPTTEQPLFPLWRLLVTPSNRTGDSSLQIIVGCEDAVICKALCTTVNFSIETSARDFTLVKVSLVLACTLLEQCFFFGS
jgi:hypothetical protein